MNTTARALAGLTLLYALGAPGTLAAQERRVRPVPVGTAERSEDRPGRFTLTVRTNGKEGVRLTYAGQLPVAAPQNRRGGDAEGVEAERRGDPVPGINIELDLNTLRPPTQTAHAGDGSEGETPARPGPDGSPTYQGLLPGLYLLTWHDGEGCPTQPLVITEEGVALMLRGIG